MHKATWLRRLRILTENKMQRWLRTLTVKYDAALTPSIAGKSKASRRFRPPHDDGTQLELSSIVRMWQQDSRTQLELSNGEVVEQFVADQQLGAFMEEYNLGLWGHQCPIGGDGVKEHDEQMDDNKY